PTGRIEPVVKEVLLELKVDEPRTAAVLFDREDGVVTERLCAHRVVREVDFRHAVELVVQEDGDVAFVGEGRRSTQVVESETPRLQSLTVGCDDAYDGNLVSQCEVFQRFGDAGDLLSFILW